MTGAADVAPATVGGVGLTEIFKQDAVAATVGR